MKKSIASKWVKALRSGKYKQGNGCLFDSNSNTYCCLGVLACIEARIPKEKINRVANLPSLGFSCGIQTALGSLPGIVINNRPFTSLAEANDSGVSFTDIANWIEKNYRKL